MSAYDVLVGSMILSEAEATCFEELSHFECVEDAPEWLVDEVVSVLDKIKLVPECDALLVDYCYEDLQDAVDELLDILTA
jgi:hypothetical protein